ncbi:MAG: 30S ribosomal protein S17 [bacterium]
MSSRTYLGKVVSNKMTSTVVVAVEMPKRHPVYKKLVRNTKRVKAHTDAPLKVGSMVEIVETKPYSKEVSFKVRGQVKEEK